jgi:hypothetical protein
MKSDDFKFEVEHQSNILIKAENKEQRQRALVMLTVLTATFLITIISLVFSVKSYKNTIKTTREEEEKAQTFYQTLITTYSNGDTINIEKLTVNYESAAKTITITNDGDSTIEYNIKITSITTNLLSTNSLIYTLTSNTGNTISKELPLQESNIVSEETLEPGNTKVYTLIIQYNGPVEKNMEYNYKAIIQVEQSNLKTDLLER